MTASYFVIKNLIQNQLMGDKVICSADTHQQNTKFIPICIFIRVCRVTAADLFGCILAFYCSALLETGEITPLPECVRSGRGLTFNFVSHFKQIVVQMGLTITVSTVSLQRTLHCLQPIMSVLKRITICLLCFHFAPVNLVFMKIF